MKSVKFFNVMSHDLTEDQRTVVERAGFEVVELPGDLKQRWGNIPPDVDPAYIAQLAAAVRCFMTEQLEAYPSFALIQGEPVLCFNLALMADPVVPLVATTRRESIEVKQSDGSVKKESIFRHVQFRPYKLYHASLVKKVGLA
jgi:hypothetical protein